MFRKESTMDMEELQRKFRRKTDIVYDEQQPLLALIYDNDEARTLILVIL